MLNRSDQEFLLFLVGCICLALAAPPIAFTVGAYLMFLAFTSDKRNKKEKEGE
jgi:hypothetical protein